MLWKFLSYLISYFDSFHNRKKQLDIFFSKFLLFRVFLSYFYFSEIAAVRNNMTQLELKAKTEEKASLEKEIKKQSQGAVGNLTEEELQVPAYSM